MAGETEPRAVTAALASPAFITRGGGGAMHAANRHIERWAPEATANRVRPLRSLGFVDRLVAPWMETAQRSAALRRFTQGVGERAGGAVSWVFPRPWYQDELDWMAAARQSAAQRERALLTTRGTYVAPDAPHEFVAPGLSVAIQNVAPSFGGGDVAQQYSPLIPLAAVSAAQLMARVVAPSSPARMSPGLRAVLATVLERAAQPAEVATRASLAAPELVTPPAPRPAEPSVEASATRFADSYAAQQAQVVEIQRIAQRTAAREIAARSAEPAARSEAARVEAVRADAARGDGARALAETARAEAARRDAAEYAAPAPSDAQRRDAERAAIDAATAERRRIEERIAQRLAERAPTPAPRLHEQARAQAASDARAPISPAPAPAEVPAIARPRVPAEVIAAIGALPAQLAAVLAERPERAIQTIDELATNLRAAELFSRSVATGSAIEPTRGPRLGMPAGLGGLVAAIDHARPIAPRPMLHGEAVVAMTREPRTVAQRMPMPAWLASPAPAMAALAASTATPPISLSHVAWSDRWLARFAGATPAALDVLASTSASRGEGRLQMLAAAAPGGVYVAPERLADASWVARGEALPGVPTIESAARRDVAGEPRDFGLRPITPIESARPPVAQQVVRFDDAAETPDDVFAAIAQAVTRGRAAPAVTVPGPAGRAAAAETPASAVPAARESFADAIARSAPSAPGAGLSAQLASSPFAPALRHLVPLAAATRFDVRALFGDALATGYLAGMFTSPAREIAVERESIGWDADYVAPAEPAEAAGVEAATGEARERAAAAPSESVAHAPLTTLRSAILSWDVIAEPFGAQRAAVGPEAARPGAGIGAQAMVEAMSLPMLGDVMSPTSIAQGMGLGIGPGHAPAEAEPLSTAPGAIATQAHRWGVAQERSSAELALDFVTPELILAARVYGLGPAEAAQAARLAIAGPGQLTAMASTVDRIFVQAMALEADRRERLAITTAYPVAGSELAPTRGRPEALAADSAAHEPAATEPAATRAIAGRETAAIPAPTGVAFGVERRTPRGAFLWPSATVAALGLHAAAPDGELSMSVAALEMLAAQAVAELGTYASLGEPMRADDARGGLVEPEAAPVVAGRSPAADAARGRAGEAAAQTTGRVEPSETDVLDSAIALVPMARRARFEALYVALGQSPAGRSWSPAARAARALALAGRGGDASTSARERAATAWDVLPVVYGEAAESHDGQIADALEASRELVAPRARTHGRVAARAGLTSIADKIDIDSQPGLGTLASRAGEALGSYVASQPAQSPRAEAARSEPSRDSGAVLRVPTAAQELVRTGRPAGRHGGGEVEIPPWFEAAARRMLDERSGVSDGISLAELTLVTSTTSNQVAASTRGVPSAVPAASVAAPHAASVPPMQQADIDKIAFEVYRQILAMMDAARARNGESYL